MNRDNGIKETSYSKCMISSRPSISPGNQKICPCPFTLPFSDYYKFSSLFSKLLSYPHSQLITFLSTSLRRLNQPKGNFHRLLHHIYPISASAPWYSAFLPGFIDNYPSPYSISTHIFKDTVPAIPLWLFIS